MGLLDIYLTLSWVLCALAVGLVRLNRRRTSWIDAPAIVIFALGWPVILPVVAFIMRLGERPSEDS